MLDIKQVLADPEGTAARLQRRSADLSVDGLVALAEERKAALREYETKRARQNELSKSAFGKGSSLSDEERQGVRAELKDLSEAVKSLDARVKELEAQLDAEILLFPNIPDDETPDGASEAEAVTVKTWGEPREHAFEALGHDVVGEKLGILDFEAAARVSGAGFALYRGLGAKLERALAAFMLDLHTAEHGYEEVLPPFLVTRDSMVGTGQLPKFEADAFVTTDDKFLIPTAEVPVTNMQREQMLSGDELPIRFCAFSACFRQEAGSYGRETKGLTRLHQFQKVELVQFVQPEDSDEAHEQLTRHAETVLEKLGLAYRRILLPAGDISFAAAKCYDLEVWLPGQKMWREISSCSNFRDFQARRANIRFKREQGAKPEFVHTLNGSGLAIGRTVMALLEHGQREDGGVDLPEALWPYMGVKSIEPKP